jgi:hypothetical protein
VSNKNRECLVLLSPMTAFTKGVDQKCQGAAGWRAAYGQ